MFDFDEDKKTKLRVLVCGDREWTDYAVILITLKTVHEISPIAVVIEGGCRGADLMAKDAAMALGIPYQEFPADWKTYGKAAGPIRNRQMLREGKPNLVIAFHNHIEKSRGTKDMLDAARAVKVKTLLIAQKAADGS